MSTPDGFIRPAVAGDLAVIESWLPKGGAVDTLAMNWPTTRKQFARGRLLVWEDGPTGRPIAYAWGTLDSTDSVLEVDPRHRRRGVARAFAGYLIDVAAASGQPLLEIDCPTDSAVQFWRTMGFEVEETMRGPYLSNRGRRMLDLAQQLPDGPRIAVSVRFMPEQAAYDDQEHAPLVSWTGPGVRDSAGAVLLEKKICCFDLDDGEKLAVELLLGGRRVYRGLAKYAGVYGVGECENGFVIQSVVQP